MESRSGVPPLVRAALVGVLTLAASTLPAQTPPTLTRGARVRITLPPEGGQPARQVSGTLERLERDTVVIARGYLPSQAVSLGGGAELEMDESRGHGGAGLLIGAALGVALTARPCDNCDGTRCPSPSSLRGRAPGGYWALSSGAWCAAHRG